MKEEALLRAAVSRENVVKQRKRVRGAERGMMRWRKGRGRGMGRGNRGGRAGACFASAAAAQTGALKRPARGVAGGGDGCAPLCQRRRAARLPHARAC